MFLLVNSTISSLMYDGYVGKYAGFDGNTTLFLSGAVENNVPLGEPDEFYRLVDKILAVDGVNGVGYQMNEYFLSGKNDDTIVDAFALSSDMLRIEYPLSKGRWFNDDSYNETQVILGGNIASVYKVNDVITLHKLEVIDESMQYIPVKAKVIGKMREPAFTINLHFSSNQPEYVNLFEPCENIIITNDSAIISSDDIRYPLMSLLVFTDENADLRSVKESLMDFGQPFDFNEVDDFYKEGILFKLANKLPTTGIMLIGILFGVIGITYLSIYQNMKTLSIYYLYGMSNKGCALVNVALDAVMLTISLVISVLLYFVPSVHDYLFRRSLIGPYNFLFSITFVIVVVGIAYIISRNFSKKSPISTLRRFE